MAILEVSVALLALGLALSIAVVLFIIIFVYTHLDKKLVKKISEIPTKEKELRDYIKKANDARILDIRELNKRMESIEQKLEVLLQPEGEAKEVAKEKVRSK